MTRDELIEEIERNPYDAQQAMIETFSDWAARGHSMTDAEFRRNVDDVIAAHDDVMERL